MSSIIIAWSLELGAWSLELGALSCTTLQDLGKVIPYTYKWSSTIEDFIFPH